MTVASENNRSGPYTGNGVTVVFPYTFRVIDKAHLQVIRSEGGFETILAVDTDFSVSDVGSNSGGNITLTVAPTASQKIVILRNVPFVQETDLENQGAFFAETIEDALDRAAMRDQQLAERVDRAVTVPASASAEDLQSLISNILVLSDISDDIQTVAGIAPAVVIVASIDDAVVLVAANMANIVTVANDTDLINQLAALAGDVVGTTDAQVLINKTIDGANNDLTVYEGDLSLSDLTTGNVSTARHGFAPKLPSNAALFLNGAGGYTAPVGTTYSAGLGLKLAGNQFSATGDLEALENLTGIGVFYYRSANNVWTPVTIGANLTFTAGTLAATGGGGGSLVPSWKAGAQTGAGWSDYRAAQDAQIARCRALPFASGVMQTVSGSYPGSNSNAHGAAVVMSDGRVYVCPYSATVAKIWDPTNDQVVNASGTFAGTGAISDAVLLRDGRIYCVPYNTTQAKLYDPATDTPTTPAGTFPGGFGHNGGVLMADGRVYCVPHNATAAQIYDPVANTLTAAGGTFPGTNAYVGGVLLPDGRVFCVPHMATVGRIYDPVSNTTTTTAATFPGSEGFAGGCLLPDGRVFCSPHKSATARIWDPVTDTVSTPAGSYGAAGTANYNGCALLPDGRVAVAPFQATALAIYDPVGNTLSFAFGVYSGVGGHRGCTVMHDGRLFLAPFNSSLARVALTGYGFNIDPQIVTSPFNNHY